MNARASAGFVLVSLLACACGPAHPPPGEPPPGEPMQPATSTRPPLPEIPATPSAETRASATAAPTASAAPLTPPDEEKPLPPGKKITRLTPKIEIYPETERTRKEVTAALAKLKAAVQACAAKVSVADMQNVGSISWTVTGDNVQRPNQGTGFGLTRAAKGTLPDAYDTCIGDAVEKHVVPALAVGHEKLEVFVQSRDDGPAH